MLQSVIHSAFQSTLPMRGATHLRKHIVKCFSDFNPHSPCGERHGLYHRFSHLTNFNPHSPCGERLYGFFLMTLSSDISIHTPHAGSDINLPQSTRRNADFNPHSPCGERLYGFFLMTLSSDISIHTPHAGSDLCGCVNLTFWNNFNPHSPCGERPHDRIYQSRECQFQSTLPMRGAT